MVPVAVTLPTATHTQNYYALLDPDLDAQQIPYQEIPAPEYVQPPRRIPSKKKIRPVRERQSRPVVRREPQSELPRQVPVYKKNAIQAAQLVEKPYQPSYFLPGKTEGTPALFLLDTGCNTNLISKHVFDRLTNKIKQTLEPCSSHGVMADGTRLPFYGIIQLTGRLREIKFQETFVVSQINEDAILGMPFLTKHGCTMEFNRPTVTVDGKELLCTDRYGRLLISSVQIVRNQTIPPGMETTVLCRLSAYNHTPLGVIESLSSSLPVASSINTPDKQRRVTVRCFNPTQQPMTLKAGTRIGTYTGIEETDIELPNSTASSISRASYREDSHPSQIPSHVREIYQEACKSCKDHTQRQRLAQMFTEYAGVFSKTDQDVGRTDLVQHDIPVAEGTQPLRQPPHRLGASKGARSRETSN